MKKKLTSRKFLAAVSGVLIGVGLIVGGEVDKGAAMVIGAIITYLIAEGYIDAKAVKSTTETVEDVAAEVAAGVAAQIAHAVVDDEAPKAEGGEDV